MSNETTSRVRGCCHGGKVHTEVVGIKGGIGEHFNTIHPFRFCFVRAEDVDMISTCETCPYINE